MVKKRLAYLLSQYLKWLIKVVIMKNEKPYNPHKKEAALRAESESWDTSTIKRASVDDIPIIDLKDYFANPTKKALNELAEQLLYASTQVGFYYLKGHGVANDLIQQTFSESKQFHQLPLVEKNSIKMDRPEWQVGGVGYLPFHTRKLPTRKKGNANEAFLIKRQAGGDKPITLADNQWLAETILPDFRQNVEIYAKAMEELALNLLPIYCRALKVEDSFFNEGFTTPMYRLRMTKYPSIKAYDEDEFGIAPHVDSTFITILAQDKEGLVIYNEKQQNWMLVPVVEDAFIINTGELLRQWTNDYFLSIKHFANNNNSDTPRYSIPFFFNANADYRMHCIPTCCSEINPPKYPPFSYLESQASVQGE